MNSVVLWAITGYQHNLIGDLVTMHVWEVFSPIGVHGARVHVTGFTPLLR